MREDDEEVAALLSEDDLEVEASTGAELGMARWRSVNHPEVEEVVEQVRQVYDVSILPPHIL